jgi:hypothetical protein
MKPQSLCDIVGTYGSQVREWFVALQACHAFRPARCSFQRWASVLQHAARTKVNMNEGAHAEVTRRWHDHRY